MKSAKKHLLCIDFESWIFSERINKKRLNLKELRKLDNGYTLQVADYILKTLKKYKQKVTFFLVFKLEQLYPGLIDKILSQGHEIGWHGHSHAVIRNTKILKKELEASKKILQKYSIKGFQAPTITFIREGYSLLKKYGFLYSSSIYGDSEKIYKLDGVYEIPVSVSNTFHSPSESEIDFPSNMRLSKVFKVGIPYGSSFFWKILGKNYYGNKLKSPKKTKVQNLFIHDWQLVTPNSKEYKKDIGFLTNPLFFPFFLVYRKNVSDIFEYLLSNFSFQTMDKYLRQKGKY